jgi:glycosyltransferase involved in cell wall biosynthesis
MIITVSKFDRDYTVKNLEIVPEKVFYNAPCLPEIFFEYKEGVPINKNNVITFCGTWIERKGVKAIESVIPGILRKYPNYIFRIIGTGEYFNVQDHFPDDVLNKIEVYPLVTDKTKLIDLYRDSSIFLFPSLCESFGLVVAEAMYCGCAVITGPTGFSADLKDEREALVLQLPDKSSVREALEKLINDDQLRSRLAEAGRKKSETLKWSLYRFELSKILDKFNKI